MLDDRSFKGSKDASEEAATGGVLHCIKNEVFHSGFLQ